MVSGEPGTTKQTGEAAIRVRGDQGQAGYYTDSRIKWRDAVAGHLRVARLPRPRGHRATALSEAEWVRSYQSFALGIGIRVNPRSEFAPFFVLDYYARTQDGDATAPPSSQVISCGSDGHSERMIKLGNFIPLVLGTGEADAKAVERRTSMRYERWAEIQAQHAAGRSLRQLARMYGVSHETIRGIVQ